MGRGTQRRSAKLIGLFDLSTLMSDDRYDHKLMYDDPLIYNGFSCNYVQFVLI